MVNGELWMVNGEWWNGEMVNCEWWIVKWWNGEWWNGEFVNSQCWMVNGELWMLEICMLRRSNLFVAANKIKIAPAGQPIYNNIEFAELIQFECYNSYKLPRWCKVERSSEMWMVNGEFVNGQLWIVNYEWWMLNGDNLPAPEEQPICRAKLNLPHRGNHFR